MENLILWSSCRKRLNISFNGVCFLTIFCNEVVILLTKLKEEWRRKGFNVDRFKPSAEDSNGNIWDLFETLWYQTETARWTSKLITGTLCWIINRTGIKKMIWIRRLTRARIIMYHWLLLLTSHFLSIKCTNNKDWSRDVNFWWVKKHPACFHSVTIRQSCYLLLKPAFQFHFN